MSYRCKDCTYKATDRFAGGCCPACGSFNVERIGKRVETIDEIDRKTPLQIFTLILFWGFLAWGLWDRYF